MSDSLNVTNGILVSECSAIQEHCVCKNNIIRVLNKTAAVRHTARQKSSDVKPNIIIIIII